MDDRAFRPVIQKLSRLMAQMGRLTVAVDGRCGSGKSTLGAMIQEELGGNLFHTDDFYLPFERRSSDWKKVATHNMDMLRLRDEIYLPASKGERIVYGAYDPFKRQLKSIAVAPEDISVIEGSYSMHPMFTSYIDVGIFVTCDKETQEERLKAREGDNFVNFKELWIPLEEQYFKDYRIEERSLVVIDTGRKALEEAARTEMERKDEDARTRREQLDASLEFFRRSSFWSGKK